MLRLLGLVVLVASAWIFISLAPYKEPTYSKSVVYISEGRAHASGVYLGGDKLLTANHVIAMGILPALLVDGADKAAPLWNSPNTELGMFTVEGMKAPKVDLDCKMPDLQVGDYVEAVGNPFDVRNVHSYGRVATVPQEYDYGDGSPPRIVQFVNMSLMPGMSGGGIFHNGKLVGITSATFGANALGLIIPLSVICKELAKWHQPFDASSVPMIGG